MSIIEKLYLPDTFYIPPWNQEVCNLFSAKYSGNPITQSTFSKIGSKFRETGDVKDLPKLRRPKITQLGLSYGCRVWLGVVMDKKDVPDGRGTFLIAFWCDGQLLSYPKVDNNILH
ncbi:hypothetical protein NQ318_015277 [Aromia moschata]|uniref:Uncharacterized protein n=1 Tax=Aromia moschata TaxID=1265417 RepID=A0AAV8YH34_9CUCU|nr:hypothetical protein NQ318_015277 [Aromia moschata]